ncbi:putative serine/threonine-protein kinase YbdM [Lentibacillus populi]|uniref:Serine/threonine-protein kinase YbdM n=1 Tax=Lentibacillus populi TaxID=1827502 RepID=A0A9W5U014_9BACI|nr:protein kinase [Lentibacillus populi]GGB49266.1 putative serine/threonine-protein kinase YbdM [Lentibacillus populi]
MHILRFIRKTYQYFVDKPLQTGTVLQDSYQVLDLIGTGSYGIVYLCKDLKTMENKGLKQLRPSKQRKRNEVDIFNKEIAVLRMLEHKNMPTLYESFSHNGNFFYVMSYMEGDNLDKQIFFKKKTFNEKESLLFLAHLLELIDYLHKKDIYHLDLRIPNIMLKNDEPFLIDFGLAKHVASDGPVYSRKAIMEMKLQDYYDLGDILLYLLYTTYSSKSKKALPWTEELSLADETVHLLKRLLRLLRPYSNSSEIQTDLHAAIKAKGGH